MFTPLNINIETEHMMLGRQAFPSSGPGDVSGEKVAVKLPPVVHFSFLSSLGLARVFSSCCGFGAWLAGITNPGMCKIIWPPVWMSIGRLFVRRRKKASQIYTKSVHGMLGLCLYSDELCPGNPLAASTNRKCWAIYAGFKEMGPVLSNEFAWITICIRRSTVVAGLEANM